jgi:hypothetical protein
MQFDDGDCILGDRLLAKGQSLVLAGPGSVGKSRLVLQLAVSCLVGRDFVGLHTHGEGLRWLILQAENSNRRLQADLRSLRQWVGDRDWPKVNSGLFIHTLETDSDGFLALDGNGTEARLTEKIQEHQADIVVFDSLYNFAAGDLNSDVDMRHTLTSMSRLVKIQNPNRATAVLHHALTGKAGAAKAIGWDRSSFGRNSKVLHSWTRGQINVSPGNPDSNDVLVLACGKCSNGREFAPFAVALNPATMIYEVAPGFDLKGWEAEINRNGHANKIFVPLELVADLAKGGKAKKELAKAIIDETGCGKTCAYSRIEQAISAKKIHRDKLDKQFYAI